MSNSYTVSKRLTISVQNKCILLTALGYAGKRGDESPLSALQGLPANSHLAIDPQLSNNFPNGHHGHMDFDVLRPPTLPLVVNVQKD